MTAAADLAKGVVKGFGMPSLAVAGGVGIASGMSGGNTYQVTINAPVGSSPADIGRELDRYLRSYAKVSGR